MASLDDLGRALRDDADASAPPASRIDVDAVISAARARRRPRQWAAGTLGLVAVLGLGGIAVGALAPPSLIAASESADSGSAGTAAPESVGADELLSEPGTARADGLLSCGAVPPAPGQGSVELAAEAVLPDGIVVGEATVVDEAAQTAIIDPGVSVDLPVRISTIACVEGGALPPGDYTVLVLASTWVSPDEPPTLAIAPESSLRLD